MRGAFVCTVSLFLMAPAAAQETKQQIPVGKVAARFQVSFGPEVTRKPFNGRVFVIASTKAIADLPPKPNWFKPEPFFAQDVSGWQAGETLNFEPGELACPKPLAELTPGKYWVQAVMDMNQGGQNPLAAPGNGYSKARPVELGPRAEVIPLHIDQIYPEPVFKETARIKLVDIESKLLSEFHGKPIRLRAGVLLPKSFDVDKARKYPIVFEIPGFGGDHHGVTRAEARKASDVAGVDMIYVVLDPACSLGHHVFADSANNGPYGQALCEELIPTIEANYRALARPEARFLTGHSSGGWSSLWLQVTYPDFFGGVWSTAPDPVDFRDFQKVDIYQPGIGLFTDAKGVQRPLARKNGKVILHYRPFSDMEAVMGRGGQLCSFEAVFSPKGKDGKPARLWDRKTGTVDSVVAKSWERYDIRLLLQRNWPTLAPKLAGKLHVYMGDEDNFYLEGATVLLQKSLRGLGSDAVIELFPGKDHSTLLDSGLRSRIAREMALAYQKQSAKSSEGWLDLFPGKDLKGWKRVPLDEKLSAKNPWSVDEENKILLCDGVGIKEMLLHEKQFGDGVFHVEWRFRKVKDKTDYNSGVYFRSKDDGKIWHQVQVAHLEKPPLLGDIFGDTFVNGEAKRFVVRGKGAELANPPGQWNTYEIECKGKDVTVRVNGGVATTWDACAVARGHVGMQAEFFFIEFKNLKFKELR